LAAFEIVPPIGNWSVFDTSHEIENFLTCMEMMAISILHPLIFSIDEYLGDETTEVFFENRVPKIQKFELQKNLCLNLSPIPRNKEML
jgi:hypothetical protein